MRLYFTNPSKQVSLVLQIIDYGNVTQRIIDHVTFVYGERKHRFYNIDQRKELHVERSSNI